MANVSAPLPQTIGRYRVLAVLGEGAMGEVVRARDDRLGRDVAIKRVKNVSGAGTAEFQARFEAEARALAALAHPGVVQIYELGLDGDEPYLVMELVDGASLRAVIKERGPLPAPAVRALGIQLARALQAAHARGILHRDVKPANVLQGPGGAWKLADFGVAHMPDSEMTSTGQFIGTPAYAAPEALALAQFSPASDVYGLAATLVEAASGKKPRRDATLAEMMARSHERATLDGVPDELAAVLRPALALDARARPDAAELAELLAGSPESGQILAAIAQRVASAPAYAAADAEETRAGGPVKNDAAARAAGTAASGRGEATVALGPRSTASAAPMATIGVPDATAAPTPATESSWGPRGGSQPGGPPLATIGVADGTALPRAASAPAMHGGHGGHRAHGAMLATPPHGAMLATATASAPASSHGLGAHEPARDPARRMSGKQMIGVAAGLLLLLAVIGRACSEDSPRNPMGGPGAASGTMPGPPGRAEPPGGRGPAGDPEAPLRFEMPPGLDRKGAQAWGDVARAVNEGKLNKALEKLEKLENRYGESEESAQLRAWLEQHAGPYGDDD
jgi:eukaryotic-like serine/threonine-protein kinase